jgi:hypothetical protein
MLIFTFKNDRCCIRMLILLNYIIIVVVVSEGMLVRLSTSTLYSRHRHLDARFLIDVFKK